jgi:hypothetical protein
MATKKSKSAEYNGNSPVIGVLPAVCYRFSGTTPVMPGTNGMWWLYGGWIGKMAKKDQWVTIEMSGHINPVHNFCGGMFASSLATYLRFWHSPHDPHMWAHGLFNCLPNTPIRRIVTLTGVPVAESVNTPMLSAEQLTTAGWNDDIRALLPNANAMLGIDVFPNQKFVTELAGNSLASAIVALAHKYRRSMIFGVDRTSGVSDSFARRADNVTDRYSDPPEVELCYSTAGVSAGGGALPPFYMRKECTLEYSNIYRNVDSRPQYISDAQSWINPNSGSRVGLWRVSVPGNWGGGEQFDLAKGQKQELYKLLHPRIISRVPASYFYN